MKNLKVIAFILMVFVARTHAQDAYEGNIENAFDFWIGDWHAEWTNAEGNVLMGSNSITKTTGGNVVEEDFSDPNSGFLGKSISVYCQQDSLWHQAWADNSGGYINLIGEIYADKRVFKTEPKTVNENIIVKRMVFYNIKAESFSWDWEFSKDGGKNWKLAWRINYTRKNSK